jgi:hypothetical protein
MNWFLSKKREEGGKTWEDSKDLDSKALNESFMRSFF